MKAPRIGDYLHRNIEAERWSGGETAQLAAYVAQSGPGLRGTPTQNPWRMRQFFVVYGDDPKLSPLVRVLPRSSHPHILNRSTRLEEPKFYRHPAAASHFRDAQAGCREGILVTVSREFAAKDWQASSPRSPNRARQFRTSFKDLEIVPTLSTQSSCKPLYRDDPDQEPTDRQASLAHVLLTI